MRDVADEAQVEVPVKKLLGGAPVSSINAATLRNPECLEEYSRLARSKVSQLS